MDRKAKIKELVRKLKRKKHKILGNVDIPGVSKPKYKRPKEVKQQEHKHEDNRRKIRGPNKQVMVGPKGVQYIQTSGGKKKYANKVKKSLENFVEESKIETFINKFRSKK
jgi:hypothetical protein